MGSLPPLFRSHYLLLSFSLSSPAFIFVVVLVFIACADVHTFSLPSRVSFYLCLCHSFALLTVPEHGGGWHWKGGGGSRLSCACVCGLVSCAQKRENDIHRKHTKQNVSSSSSAPSPSPDARAVAPLTPRYILCSLPSFSFNVLFQRSHHVCSSCLA